ncbi:MAG: hypothetical protein WC788_04350 [Candidatus Paceibacterota bacterium]
MKRRYMVILTILTLTVLMLVVATDRLENNNENTSFLQNTQYVFNSPARGHINISEKFGILNSSLEDNKILDKYGYGRWTEKERNELHEMINITIESAGVFNTYVDISEYILDAAKYPEKFDDMQYAEILLRNGYREWTEKEKFDFFRMTNITAGSPNVRNTYWDLLRNEYRQDWRNTDDKYQKDISYPYASGHFIFFG